VYWTDQDASSKRTAGENPRRKNTGGDFFDYYTRLLYALLTNGRSHHPKFQSKMKQPSTIQRNCESCA